MATPVVAENAPYKPANPMFYSELMALVDKALEGNPVAEQEDAWRDPAFTRAYGYLDALEHLTDAGHLAPIMCHSLGRDVLAIKQSLCERRSREALGDARLTVLIGRLGGQGLSRYRPLSPP